MRTFIKLCRVIVRKSKGFSAGIFIISVLSVAVAFLGANFGASSYDTIMDFISASGTPDVIYMTDLMKDTARSAMEEIEGIRYVSPEFFYDTNMETDNGTVYSVRIFRTEKDSPFTNSVHKRAEYNGTGPQAALSDEFANHNGISAGDLIRIDTPFGKKDVFVKEIVSNPETIGCVKDEMSAYENYQFGYLYLSDSDFEKLSQIKGMTNRWLIYFEAGLSVTEQKECMRNLRAELGNHLVSETLMSESDEMNSIRDELNTIQVLCSFIPGVIWLISLGFNFIFIKIIVENQRKNIGLLRALGFSIRKVVLLFVTYTVLLNLPALLFGILAGWLLLKECLSLIAAAKGILSVTVTISRGITALTALTVFVIGIAASLLSARQISKIDPVEAYGGPEVSSFEPPAFLSRLKMNSFAKIAVVSTVRNYKRQIIGALCIAACIISMCIGFEGVLTIGNPINAVYGDRYRYDLMVRSLSGDAVSRILTEVSGVTAAEPSTLFSSEILGNSVRVSTIPEDAELTVLTNARGERIVPENGIIIDEMFAKTNNISVGDSVVLDGHLLPVTGIAREIVYTVQYISPQTAAEIGYDTPNCVLLKLDADTPISEVETQITKICDDSYFVRLASQKEQIRDGFKAMRTIMLLFAVLAFCIGSLLVLNITIIDFNENRYKYAALRALGTPAKRLSTISALQNLFRVVPGIIVACPFCYVCVSVLLSLLSGPSQQYVMVKYTECLIISCLITLLYVLLGMGISQSKIRKIDFCSSLNEME